MAVEAKHRGNETVEERRDAFIGTWEGFLGTEYEDLAFRDIMYSSRVFRRFGATYYPHSQSRVESRKQ
jgi:hypothetical protein